MIELQNYINMIDEAGWSSKPGKNVGKDDLAHDDDRYRVTDLDDVDVNKIPDAVADGKKASLNKANVNKGKSADDNGTKGLWAIDPPAEEDKDGDSWQLLDYDVMTENMQSLLTCMTNEEDFFVQGEAGWGKTDQIIYAAHKCGLTVLTVYLDKAEATDLGGIPLPTSKKTKKGELTYTSFCMPAWAVYMAMHPETKFLLFFDEMNQAQPEVMNALMPIVLKHEVAAVRYDNFFVGAAGNYESENASVNELSKPLASRFNEINWECRTDDTWKAAFSWAHEQYDDKCGAELINKCEELKDCWDSPRNITRYIYQRVANAIKKPALAVLYTKGKGVDIMYKNLMQNVVWKDAKRLPENKLREFAEWLVNYIKNGGKSDDGTSSRRKKSSTTNEGITKEMKDTVVNMLRKGYVISGGKKYLVTPDNLIGTSDDVSDDGGDGIFGPEDGLVPEMLKRIIRQMEDEGLPPKFKNQEEGVEFAKKKGWVIINPSK